MLENLQQFLTGLADNYRANEIDKREIEHRILEAIADEIDNNSLDRATWLKAFSEAEANDAKAKALYIKYRKERLFDQLDAIHIQLKRENERRQQQAKDAKKQNAEAERSNRRPVKSSAPATSRILDEPVDLDRKTGAWVLFLIAVLLAALSIWALITYKPTPVEAEGYERHLPNSPSTYAMPKIPTEFEDLRNQIEKDYFAEADILNSYALIRASCGLGCTVNFIGDHTTGEIHHLELGGENMQSLEFLTANNTNHVTAQWEDREAGICHRQGYQWTGSSLEPTSYSFEFALSVYERGCPPF